VASAIIDGVTPGSLSVACTLGNGTSRTQGLFIEMFGTAALVLSVLMTAAGKFPTPLHFRFIGIYKGPRLIVVFFSQKNPHLHLSHHLDLVLCSSRLSWHRFHLLEERSIPPEPSDLLCYLVSPPQTLRHKGYLLTLV